LNYIGKDKEGGPVIVSVCKECKSENQYATLIRTKLHDLFGYMVNCSNYSKVIKRVTLISPEKYKNIVWKLVKEPEIIQDLINFEEKQVII